MEESRNRTLDINAERQQRIKDCTEEINQVLVKHDCSLHSHQDLIDGTPKGLVTVIILANS